MSLKWLCVIPAGKVNYTSFVFSVTACSSEPSPNPLNYICHNYNIICCSCNIMHGWWHVGLKLNHDKDRELFPLRVLQFCSFYTRFNHIQHSSAFSEGQPNLRLVEQKQESVARLSQRYEWGSDCPERRCKTKRKVTLPLMWWQKKREDIAVPSTSSIFFFSSISSWREGDKGDKR